MLMVNFIIKTTTTNFDTLLNLIAGQGIILTTDAANDSITISSNVAFQSFGVLSRSGNIVTTLTPLLQTYIDYDTETFRNPVGKIVARTGDILVTG